MSEEIIWPPLQAEDSWQTEGVILIRRKQSRLGPVNMAWVDQLNGKPKILVKVWKNGVSNDLKRYVVMGECDDLQQAINMAAALVALGEADE